MVLILNVFIREDCLFSLFDVSCRRNVDYNYAIEKVGKGKDLMGAVLWPNAWPEFVDYCRDVLKEELVERNKKVLPCTVKVYFNHYFILEGIYCMFLCKSCFVFLPSLLHFLSFVSTFTDFSFIKECCDQNLLLASDFVRRCSRL